MKAFRDRLEAAKPRFEQLIADVAPLYGLQPQHLTFTSRKTEPIIMARMEVVRVMDQEFSFSNPLLATLFGVSPSTVFQMRQRISAMPTTQWKLQSNNSWEPCPQCEGSGFVKTKRKNKVV